MLDGGSTAVVISDKLVDKLNLQTTTKWTRLYTVEGVTEKDRVMADLAIGNLNGDINIHISQAIVADVLMTKDDRPPKNSETLGYPYLNGVTFTELANDDVDLLLSVDYARLWLGGEVRRSTMNRPIALKTPFGWALAGGGGSENDAESSCFRTAVEIDNGELHGMIEKLFQTDFPKIASNHIHPSLEDEHAMKQLRETVRFDKELGHWRCGLPYVKTREEAAKRLNGINSSEHALRRLKKSIAKLRHNSEHLQFVKNQMNSMFETKHAVFLEDEEMEAPEGCPSWVLPLHIVFHPNKPTKPRCCHDGASKLSGTCLNDNLLKGEDLLNSLVGTILRFRSHKVTMSSDIKGFFHHIYVDERDQHAFKFWWFTDEELTKPKMAMLKVHIFGAKSSPTVCAFVLKHLAETLKGEISPDVFFAIMRAFYVDDFLASYADVATARRVRIELTAALKKGGLELTKWQASHPAVLEDEPANDDDVKDFENEAVEETADKVLGVRYSFRRDEFFFAVKPEKVTGEITTRRKLLGTISSCFDPIGLICPFILTGKLLFQEAITDKTLGWDDPLSQDLRERIEKWQKQILDLSGLRIPRWLKTPGTVEAKPQLHIFSDSSKHSYGYAAYRRAQNGEEVALRFLFAKSRVIPANADESRHHNSIPRFELTACRVAADFYEEFLKETEEEYERVFFWCDSQCALKQIKGRQLRPDTFVQNRLSVIRAKTRTEDWHYVNTKDNPADIVSRELKSSDLLLWDIFHHGPLFLRSPDWEAPEAGTEEPETVTVAEAATTEEVMEETAGNPPDLLYYR